jgi:hypothetical protein
MVAVAQIVKAITVDQAAVATQTPAVPETESHNLAKDLTVE